MRQRPPKLARPPALIARQIIARHGLHASAVAQEYAAQAKIQGDPAAWHRWQQVRLAIGEMRRCKPIS